ncbi:MAG: hypothetical protein ACT4NY_11595 [Pseudonocardiales bacterium]
MHLRSDRLTGLRRRLARFLPIVTERVRVRAELLTMGYENETFSAAAKSFPS